MKVDTDLSLLLLHLESKMAAVIAMWKVANNQILLQERMPIWKTIGIVFLGLDFPPISTTKEYGLSRAISFLQGQLFFLCFLRKFEASVSRFDWR